MDQQQTIDMLIAEKTALDQSYVQEIRNCLELRKQNLMKDKYIEDLNKQIQKLLEEKNSMELELDNLKLELDNLKLTLAHETPPVESEPEISE